VSGDLDTSQLRAAFVQAQAQIMNNGEFTPVVVIDKALALSLLDEIERLRGIQRAVVALARTVLGKSEHPVERSPWIDVIHMMDDEARRER
jgi:hypothetical protein